MTTSTPFRAASIHSSVRAAADRPDRVRSAASVVVASVVLLGSLVAAAYLAQNLLERGLLFMSA
ncbi:hypothetical protein [Pengzhenrongella sicca]|uniref:Uncharacterized protein n=1 Tax=Pengzhenrongella sicca TaxID=2819238 RepID=A0A8A4ZAY5_9MICO|nr:hypothetical protein [Pengzhenrongella sicca]QTE29140.1 hypothetical protein J4E96_17890 [Pengzhenrongella sicca]